MGIKTLYANETNNDKSRGVLIYVSSDTQVTILECPSTCAFQECIFLMLMDKISKGYLNNLIIGNIYRNPNSTQDNDDKLYNLLCFMQQTFK